MNNSVITFFRVIAFFSLFSLFLPVSFVSAAQDDSSYGDDQNDATDDSSDSDNSGDGATSTTTMTPEQAVESLPIPESMKSYIEGNSAIMSAVGPLIVKIAETEQQAVAAGKKSAEVLKTQAMQQAQTLKTQAVTSGTQLAGAATVAGAKKLYEEGIIALDDIVVCISTGHQLKDPAATVDYHTGGEDPGKDSKFKEYGINKRHFANKPVRVPNDLEKILEIMEKY